MDMNQSQLALNEVFVGNKYSLTSDIMRDVQHNKHFEQAFRRSFFIFIDTVSAMLQLPLERRDVLELMYKMKLRAEGGPDEFVRSFMLIEFNESARKAEYLALFQNAFIYAVAACYKSQIKSTYMQASEKSKRTEVQNTEYMMTGKVNGSYLVGSPDYKAAHPDKAYIKYVITTHTLFAGFATAKHRFQYKKILAVTGYLINPNLDKG